MTTCDMCGCGSKGICVYKIKLIGGELNTALHMLDMCSKCQERLRTKISKCIRNCRVSTVRDAVKGLTPEQVQQVEAYVAQQEARREVPS